MIAQQSGNSSCYDERPWRNWQTRSSRSALWHFAKCKCAPLLERSSSPKSYNTFRGPQLLVLRIKYDQQLTISKYLFTRLWRNWQTRKTKDLVGNTLQVQLLLAAPLSFGSFLLRGCQILGLPAFNAKI